MRQHHRQRRSWLTPCRTIRIAALPVLLGCPVPHARTEASSSPVVGRVLRADGAPLAGLMVAVVTGWEEDPCKRPALEAQTDASGQFAFVGTQEHFQTTWVVPNLHRLAPRFRLCVEAAGVLQPAYTGVGSLTETAEPDTVTCLAWEWESRPRVTCTGRAERSIVEGGQWVDSAGTGGFYRVIRVDEPTRVRGYDADRPQERPHVYVQWIETTSTSLHSAPTGVRATVALPIDRDKVWALRDADIWRRAGRWTVTLYGYKRAFMNDVARAELVFELGGPGQATLTAGP